MVSRDSIEQYLNIKFPLPAERTTAKPLIVAMVGLEGSGKTELAELIKDDLGAHVVEEDELRLFGLVKGHRSVLRVGTRIAVALAKEGVNSVLDADYVDDQERLHLREQAIKVGARLAFVRTLCDPGTSILSFRSEPYAAIRMACLWERTPLHYEWEPDNRGSGKWVPLEFPFKFAFATVDTTDEKRFKSAATCLVRDLKNHAS